MLQGIVEAFRRTIEIYQSFNGSSAYLVIFLAALFYLWITERERSTKIILVYLSGSVFLLFFCPIFSYIAMRFFLDSETYYRFLWLLPVGVVVSLAIIRLIEQTEYKIGKIIAGIASAIIIILNGSLIYQNPAVSRAENMYHLPQQVIEVADQMKLEETWVRAVVPSELVQFLRQYEGYITMPYGREMLIDRWEMNHDLFMAMEAETVHAEYITILCRENEVDYIVLRKSTQISGNFNEFGFEKIAQTEMYDIYLDKYSMVYDQRMAQEREGA